MSRVSHDLRFVTLALGAAVCLGSAVASAADGASDRHPSYLLSPTHKPAGVPANYVLTHNGFFHPSCVVTVNSDEVTGVDLVIRGLDGSERARFAPCAYPHYGRDGAVVAPSHAPPVHAAPLYDGYIVYYSYYGTLPVAPTLTTDWTVPLAPTKVNEQDIAFFNDILTNADGGNILQPVLDYNGEVQNHWAVESEQCCTSGNDMQTTPVNVNVGDKIRGIVVGSNCASSGVCQNWAVTTTDLTTGGTTTLNTTASAGLPNGVSPASLETYGVTSCDMFPASGELAFIDNQLTSSEGTKELKYDLLILDGANAEVPTNCGYAGLVSGDNYTLIYGTVASGGAGGIGAGGIGAGGIGAGGSSAGGTSGGGAGGKSGAAGALGAGGAAGANGGTSGVAGGGGSLSSAGTSDQAGASSSGSGAGGASNVGGGAGAVAAGGSVGGGSAGASSAKGGAAGASTNGAGQPGSGSAGDGSGSSNDNSGCSCELARSTTTPSSPLAPALALFGAASVLFRRRKSS